MSDSTGQSGDGKSADARRPGLRWLTLAEIVGVAALVIAGLGYWDSHRERMDQERQRAADSREREAQTREAARKPAFLMTGAPVDDGQRLRLTSVHPEQVIQTQTFWFPAEIRKDGAEVTGQGDLRAAWIDDGLRKVAKKQKSGRVPVTVVTIFVEDGQMRRNTALYQLAYSLKGRFLQGDRVELDGLSLARQDVAGSPQAAADTLWAAR